MTNATSEVNQQPTEAQKPKRGRKTRPDARQARIDELRKKRVPLGRSTLTLDCERYKEEGWSYRIFNDQKDRLAQAQAAGWEFVTDPDKANTAGEGHGDSNISLGTTVCFNAGGPDGVKAYLMRIPEEIYSDSVAAGQAAVDEIDDAIHNRGGGKEIQAEGGKVYAKEGHRMSHSKNTRRS
jgi:hypothetical protein